MNCIPSGMELFPAVDIEQFEFIKTVINDCDYYLLIIGGKYGSMTEEGVSYTEKEYDYAIEKGIKVIAFLHKNPEKLPMEDSEVSEKTIEKLKAFRKKVSKARLVEFWENKDQLAGMVALGITSVSRMYPAIGWVRADKTSTFESLEENNALRKKNSELEEKLIKFKESTPSNSHNRGKLATLDSTLEISVVDVNANVILNENVSWSAILKCIATIVFNPISEYYVSNEITNLCLKHNETVTIPTHARLSPQDFNTIKVQFYALGYITMRDERDPDDGEYYLAWEATEEGKRIILDLVAIKA
ncbi:DUF4062 domain-containing protein [Moritella viscosa]